jgi:rhamnogalacturonan endolyase
VLRVAVNGTGTRPEADFSVNGVPQGRITFGVDDGSMTRHQINGVWKLVDTPFDAALLQPGENTITLTVPAGRLTNGFIYDYLRLELNDGGP